METQEPSDTRQVCLKLSASAYEELEMRAGSFGMATTSLARWYVLKRLGMADQFVRRRTGKRKVAKPLTQEMKLKIAQLRELQLIRLNLELIQRGQAERCNGPGDDLGEALDGAKQAFKSLLAKSAGQGT